MISTSSSAVARLSSRRRWKIGAITAASGRRRTISYLGTSGLKVSTMRSSGPPRVVCDRRSMHEISIAHSGRTIW